MGILSPAFKKRKANQNVLFTAAIFQVLLTQNSQYAKPAFFGCCVLNSFSTISNY